MYLLRQIGLSALLFFLSSCTSLFYPHDVDFYGLDGPPIDKTSKYSDLQPDEQELRRAYLAAIGSSLVYKEPAEAVAALDAMGFHDKIFIDNAGTSDGQAMVASIGDYTFVSFRGTVSAKDWKSILKLGSTKLDSAPHLRVHKGVANVWYDLRKTIYSALEQSGIKPNQTSKKLIVSGHSQGGAIATLAATELSAKGYTITSCNTFGTPKIAKDDISLPFEYNRFVYHNDIAVRLPPGFKHIGNGIYSRHYGVFSSTDHSRSYWPSISNHFMVHYINTLSQHLLTRSNDDTTRAVIDWGTKRNTPLHEIAGIRPSSVRSFVSRWAK